MDATVSGKYTRKRERNHHYNVDGEGKYLELPEFFPVLHMYPQTFRSFWVKDTEKKQKKINKMNKNKMKKN